MIVRTGEVIQLEEHGRWDYVEQEDVLPLPSVVLLGSCWARRNKFLPMYPVKIVGFRTKHNTKYAVGVPLGRGRRTEIKVSRLLGKWEGQPNKRQIDYAPVRERNY